MSGLIQERIDALSRRIRLCQGRHEPMPLGLGYVALTVDIISSYALADCYHLLERKDLGVEYHHSIISLIHSGHFIRHLTWLYRLLRKLPKSVVTLMQPQMKSMLKIVQRMQDDMRCTISGLDVNSSAFNSSVFARLLESDLPPEEKSLDRLGREGMVMIIAGSEAASQTLSIITYHLLANPDKLATLRTQLEQAIPSPNDLPLLSQLETIPYLYACIQEGLRLAHGIAGRLARVSRHPIIYRDWEIPPGTPVGMTCVFTHQDEAIFPDHKAFKPERWLMSKGEGRRLEKYLLSFGRDTRQCIGINLAYAELYMTVATIFRRFDLELFETDRSTVEYSRDFFNAFPEERCDGVKVLVK
ncbi:MAG: hypothetical protein Q9179_005399 [Wetmoreana sp. 5 TL-2023]